MSHKRIPKRKAAIAVGGVAALGAAALLLPNANASQSNGDAATPRTFKTNDVANVASMLATQLGDTYAGSYYDAKQKQLVVNIVGNNSNAVDQIEKAGAVAHRVQNSTAALQTAAKTLKADASVPGTAWSVDPKTNEIRVTADSTVTGDKWDTVESTVKGLGSGVATLTKSAGTLKPFVDGGDAIFGGNARCSLGFNVTAGDGTPAFLTAGHCGVAAAKWSDSAGGAPIATVDQATFPGNGDFSLVKYDDPATQTNSAVNVGNGQSVQINAAVEAAVGQQVFRMGSTTGLHDGNVTGLNATVNYPEGTVTGLIQTDVCAEPGDSGGSLFTQDGGAVGLTSGGSGDCTNGGETFFQPVTTALAAVGATLGAGDAGAGAGDAGAGAGDAGAGAGDAGVGAGDAGAGDAGAGAGDAGAGGAVDPSASAEAPGAGDAVDPSASASDAAGAGADQNGTHHKSHRKHQ
ncbi:S1 family peptidase [Streptomyces triticiradicis]|uniref:S1 family peptidase n=1 Tax=Streptomyces triticiradicis TaxID=2651189 RepID=A0A7J5DP39_9ACTN|nr:S1 family peptidase [Streptomyces triticiradicis]KAB1990533.1 S1 family peptidase [Streptomyces triticiradicis]